MPALKADIITQLKKDILALQGFRPLVHAQQKIDLGTINHSFPHSTFPLGANHEFICNSKENLTASSGFIAGILSALLQRTGAGIWISSSHFIFPPALVSFGIEPSQLIFIYLRNQKEILWATEEALKCEGLTAVVSEISSMDLSISRRLQLASEQSRVTGFFLRHKPKQVSTTVSVCRWQVQHLPGDTEDGLPGVGFPKWQVELLKVRNGKPGGWQLEWKDVKFNEVINKRFAIVTGEHKLAV